jgi:hypothetical protein
LPIGEFACRHVHGIPMREAAVLVRGVPESRLTLEYPALKHFSLLHMGEDPHIRLGFRGRDGLDDAMRELRQALDEAAIEYVEAPVE